MLGVWEKMASNLILSRLVFFQIIGLPTGLGASEGHSVNSSISFLPKIYLHFSTICYFRLSAYSLVNIFNFCHLKE